MAWRIATLPLRVLLLCSLRGASAKNPAVRLRSGVEMPVLAAGTWQYTDLEAKQLVEESLKAGFTHIDTAYDYHNQQGVSAGLQAAGKGRDEVFITTKVPGCGLQNVSRNRCKEDTLARVKEDLELLNSHYHVGILDLVLIHFPPCMAADPSASSPIDTVCFHKQSGCAGPENCDAVAAQWSAMEEAYALNLTRAIGVSNYCAGCFRCLSPSSASLAPMVNQVQLHVGMGPDPEGFASFARSHDVVLQAWSPLGHGGHGSKEILEGNLTTSIARKHGKSAAQVALKWLLSHNVSVATKSSNPEHLRENLDIFDFELDREDLSKLDAADFAHDDTPSFLCRDQTPSDIYFV